MCGLLVLIQKSESDLFNEWIETYAFNYEERNTANQ